MSVKRDVCASYLGVLRKDAVPYRKTEKMSVKRDVEDAVPYDKTEKYWWIGTTVKPKKYW